MLGLIEFVFRSGVNTLPPSLTAKGGKSGAFWSVCLFVCASACLVVCSCVCLPRRAFTLNAGRGEQTHEQRCRQAGRQTHGQCSMCSKVSTFLFYKILCFVVFEKRCPSTRWFWVTLGGKGALLKRGFGLIEFHFRSCVNTIPPLVDGEMGEERCVRGLGFSFEPKISV